MSTPEEIAQQRGWPLGVRPFGYDGVEFLGIGNDGRPYWDGKPFEIRQRLSLTLGQKILATAVSIAVIIGSLGAAAQGLDAGYNFGCKLHWSSCSPRAENEVPAISPQSTPPATSPQSASQKLLPGTKFQQR